MQAGKLSVVLKLLLPVQKRGGEKKKTHQNTNWLEGVEAASMLYDGG